MTVQAKQVEAIVGKWIDRLGGGFHPETSGAEYECVGGGLDGHKSLTPEAVAEYDRDMAVAFASGIDPCEVACDLAGVGR